MITTTFVHDITLMGSIVGEGRAEISEDALLFAEREAARISREVYPGRLIRVQDLDGIDIVAEFRNGVKRESF